MEKAKKDFWRPPGACRRAGQYQPIKDGLGLVNQQWIFFEAAINQKAGGDKRLPTNVATTSERILEEMEGWWVCTKRP